ncbi:hypothetical protein [Streptomyces sp. H27-H5]|uniref:hypothetical protein n=1 Tax=Streptomyces sp. H27-H5 TaxID=2996460 RepID=UPI002271D029|nr:hypothetical protein [Streptomyces sp. H27-H5]MCY0957694.1 hypothetical protein [Streptomyces sp. H27-H5]
MSDTEEETTEEPFRIRDVFQFRRPEPDPAEHEDEDGDEEEPEHDEPETPPMPEAPPLIPAQAPVPAPLVGRDARPDGHRVPNWWEGPLDLDALTAVASPSCRHPRPYTFKIQETGEVVPHWCPDCKTDLFPTPEPAPTPAPPWNHSPQGTPPPAGSGCLHRTPHEVRAQPTNQLVAFWCADCQTQLPVPDDYDELDDVAEEADGGEDGKDGQPAGQVPAAVRRRWGLRGNGEKNYRRPVYARDSDTPKQSLYDSIKGMPPKTRHLLYNGSALGAGLYIGVPQFWTAEVAFLVDTYHSWTTSYVVIWYGVALGCFVFDYKARHWFPLFAWAARVPLVSMIIGVLYYGTPGT